MLFGYADIRGDITFISRISSSTRALFSNLVFVKTVKTEHVSMRTVWAISVETGETLWKHEQRAGHMSLVATGGGLIFGGDVAGDFKAYDELTSEVLWQTNLGLMISGYPVSYAVDGKQYIAVSSGTSLVGQAALGVTPDVQAATESPQLVVFALP